MTTVLLVLHMQKGVVEPYGAPAEAVVERLGVAIDAARAADIPVIQVRMAFREGLVDVKGPNKARSFGARFEEQAAASQIVASLVREPADLVVVNKRASAFKGSDLDVLLRSLDATDLVLGGIGTSGVVVATFIEAADLDYSLTILSDGCTDPDPDVHRILMEKLFPVRAAVTTVAEWIAAATG